VLATEHRPSKVGSGNGQTGTEIRSFCVAKDKTLFLLGPFHLSPFDALNACSGQAFHFSPLSGRTQRSGVERTISGKGKNRIKKLSKMAHYLLNNKSR